VKKQYKSIAMFINQRRIVKQSTISSYTHASTLTDREFASTLS